MTNWPPPELRSAARFFEAVMVEQIASPNARTLAASIQAHVNGTDDPVLELHALATFAIGSFSATMVDIYGQEQALATAQQQLLSHDVDAVFGDMKVGL
ncbi:hypothetical protein [Subtercola lobariae]|uniref:Uncharacterized protein n=1 Tax=Subtercola lobariae TaxID=1588641 RepID=A0A917B148_9MICO|nr:hypothetical protein [Subtercola lobariae]GGF11395.1 hypothetical protein GCM10011399_01550 [Subtercola lobariae]